MFSSKVKASDFYFGQPAQNLLGFSNEVGSDPGLGSSHSVHHSSSLGRDMSQIPSSQDLFAETPGLLEPSEMELPNSAYDKYMSLKPINQSILHGKKWLQKVPSFSEQTEEKPQNNLEDRNVLNSVQDTVRKLHECIKQLTDNVKSLKSGSLNENDVSRIVENFCNVKVTQLSDSCNIIQNMISKNEILINTASKDSNLVLENIKLNVIELMECCKEHKQQIQELKGGLKDKNDLIDDLVDKVLDKSNRKNSEFLLEMKELFHNECSQMLELLHKKSEESDEKIEQKFEKLNMSLADVMQSIKAIISEQNVYQKPSIQSHIQSALDIDATFKRPKCPNANFMSQTSNNLYLNTNSYMKPSFKPHGSFSNVSFISRARPTSLPKSNNDNVLDASVSTIYSQVSVREANKENMGKSVPDNNGLVIRRKRNSIFDSSFTKNLNASVNTSCTSPNFDQSFSTATNALRSQQQQKLHISAMSMNNTEKNALPAEQNLLEHEDVIVISNGNNTNRGPPPSQDLELQTKRKKIEPCNLPYASMESRAFTTNKTMMSPQAYSVASQRIRQKAEDSYFKKPIMSNSAKYHVTTSQQTHNRYGLRQLQNINYKTSDGKIRTEQRPQSNWNRSYYRNAGNNLNTTYCGSIQNNHVLVKEKRNFYPAKDTETVSNNEVPSSQMCPGIFSPISVTTPRKKDM